MSARQVPAIERPRATAAESCETAAAHGGVAAALQRYYEAQDHLRRGVCLLNAGAYDAAAAQFSAALLLNPDHAGLPRYLAACCLPERRYSAAAAHLRRGQNIHGDDEAIRISHALALWKAGQTQRAIETLRDGLRQNRDSAELHFQLGTLLAALDDYEEAELRFAQAINLDGQHADALMGLALCRALHHRPQEAVTYLSRAQKRRPDDAHIGLLLAYALKSAAEQGAYAPTLAQMPTPDPVADEESIEQLSRLIEAEPDFVDAFLSLPAEQVNDEVFTMLAATIQQALARQPEHADLHYHCGRVLERLGRPSEAIAETERAVAINPRLVQALIQLGRLYHQTDRLADATTRLEQAIAEGVEYADVYYLLGNLYQRRGDIQRARGAYRSALRINERFEAAREALAALP